MRWFLVAAGILLSASHVSEAQTKCPVNTINVKPFLKFTETKKGLLSRHHHPNGIFDDYPFSQWQAEACGWSAMLVRSKQTGLCQVQTKWKSLWISNAQVVPELKI